MIKVKYGGAGGQQRQKDDGGRRAMDIGAAEVDEAPVFNGRM